jgi:hypothetical protein
MGIETWVYRYLGCPSVSVPRDVLCDIVRDERAIDWIRLVDDGEIVCSGNSARLVNQIVLRGGCDLAAISHYLAHITSDFVLELPFQRGGREIRIDHSSYLKLALDGVDSSEREILERLGYLDEDWHSEIASPVEGNGKNIWIISFWIDNIMALYRHRVSGLVLPFNIPVVSYGWKDILEIDDDVLRQFCVEREMRSAVDFLKGEFECYGTRRESDLRAIVRKLMDRAGGHTVVYFLLAPERRFDSEAGVNLLDAPVVERNRWVRDEVDGDSRIVLVNVDDFIDPESHRIEPFHLDRVVYIRVAQFIEKSILEKCAGSSDL